ncbi:MAG: PAP2 family protein, partial [Mesorhizobium sp.]
MLANHPRPGAKISRRRGEVWLVWAGLLVAILALAFGALAEEALEGDTTSFDTAILSSLRSTNMADPIGPPWLQEAARDVTSLGSVVFLGFVLFAAVGY